MLYVMQITMYNALAGTSHVGNECRQSNHQGDECTEGAIEERTSFKNNSGSEYKLQVYYGRRMLGVL